MRTCPPLAALTLLAACAGSDGTTGKETDDTGTVPGEVTVYELTITILTPLNEPAVFEGVATVTLRVEPAIGETWEVELADLESGQYEQAEGLPAIEDATIAIIGRDTSGRALAFGRSERLSIDEGERPIQVLVSEVDRMGWLTDLPTELSGGVLVADGTGRFLLFGGSEEGLYGGTDSGDDPTGVDTVLAFDVARPDTNLQFSEVGTMPPLSDGGFSGRVGHTATLLTGQHADNGKILVVGGASDYQMSQDASDSVFLWDPSDDSYEELGRTGSLYSGQFHQVAVEDANGNVVIAGGSEEVSGGGISPTTQVHVYRPSSRAMEQVDGTPTSPMIWHAAARLGTDGVLICGGVEIGTTNTLSDQCDLVLASGEIVSAGTALPLPLAHHQMTTLSDGSVLVTGGLTADGAVSEGEMLASSDSAFVYNGVTWRNAGPMKMGRAMHRAGLLPDGRVLVVGGVSQSETLFWNGESPLACAEIFDPTNAAEPFSLVDDCDSSSTSATLSEAAAEQMLATDLDYGVLVAGGMSGRNNRSIGPSALFVGAPE